MFAEMLTRFDRLRSDEFGLDEIHHDALRQEVERWRARATEIEHEHELRSDRGIGL